MTEDERITLNLKTCTANLNHSLEEASSAGILVEFDIKEVTAMDTGPVPRFLVSLELTKLIGVV